MLFRVSATFKASSCLVKFCNQGRIVLLTFDGDEGRAWVSVPEAVMAQITGQFLKERLFGLH